MAQLSLKFYPPFLFGFPYILVTLLFCFHPNHHHHVHVHEKGCANDLLQPFYFATALPQLIHTKGVSLALLGLIN